LPAAWKIDVKSCERHRNIRQGETRLNICAEAVFLNSNFNMTSDEAKNKTVQGTAQKRVSLTAAEQERPAAKQLVDMPESFTEEPSVPEEPKEKPEPVYAEWQIAYAELYFPEVHWPAFNKRDLYTALKVYQGRDRRFGAIKE